MTRRGQGRAVAGVVVMLASLAGAAAVAQEVGPPRGRGGPPDAIALQQLFDSYVLMQAQQQLQLTPEQAPQFITRLTGLQEARRRAFRRRAVIIQELRRMTQGRNRGGEASGQDSLITERLKDLEEVDVRSAADVKQALDTLDQVLAPRQRARFRVLEEQLERSKLDILIQARRGRVQ